MSPRSVEDTALTGNTGPVLRYSNDRAREMRDNVDQFTRLVNDDLYDLLRWAETLRQALAEIATLDPPNADHARQIARATLESELP